MSARKLKKARGGKVRLGTGGIARMFREMMARKQFIDHDVHIPFRKERSAPAPVSNTLRKSDHMLSNNRSRLGRLSRGVMLAKGGRVEAASKLIQSRMNKIEKSLNDDEPKSKKTDEETDEE